jgi:hypothetical protein
LRRQLTGLAFAPIYYSAFVYAFAGTFMPVTAAGDVARFFWLERHLSDTKKSCLLSGMIVERVVSLLIKEAEPGVWTGRHDRRHGKRLPDRSVRGKF